MKKKKIGRKKVKFLTNQINHNALKNREGFHSERKEKNGSDRNHAHTRSIITESFFSKRYKFTHKEEDKWRTI
jgi:hypothetical protein